MAKRQNYIAWCLWALVLSGCAGHIENTRFELDSQTAPIFSGTYKRDIFLDGSVAYQDKAKTQFKGKFDSKGFPRRGMLSQSYLDTNNKPLMLTLSGDFSLNAAQSALSFSGDFTITDAQQRIIAQGEESHWQAVYANLHPLRGPPIMAMAGDHQYLQFRPNISPKDSSQAYPIVHFSAAGPFLIEAGFRQGLPHGEIKISAQNPEQEFLVVERQYFNYQVLPQPIEYFYFEPGSFSTLALLGDCQRAPNLTVPQRFLQAFAYDCDKGAFYALSNDYPASVLKISAKDIDNGGSFHRVQIYRHSNVINATVDVDAIYDGEWLYHGPVTEVHYGSLKSYRQYELGKAIGIGIDVNERGAKYASFGEISSPPTLADTDFRDSLNTRYERYIQRLNTHFANALGDTILSQRELAKLKSALLQDINENQAVSDDEQIAGLLDLWTSWQRQSAARLSTWDDSAGDSVAVIKAHMLEDLNKWYEQSSVLLLRESALRCARSGQSFNDQAWQCEQQPDKSVRQVCGRYFDELQCAAMSTAFTDTAIAN